MSRLGCIGAIGLLLAVTVVGLSADDCVTCGGNGWIGGPCGVCGGDGIAQEVEIHGQIGWYGCTACGGVRGNLDGTGRRGSGGNNQRCADCSGTGDGPKSREARRLVREANRLGEQYNTSSRWEDLRAAKQAIDRAVELDGDDDWVRRTAAELGDFYRNVSERRRLQHDHERIRIADSTVRVAVDQTMERLDALRGHMFDLTSVKAEPGDSNAARVDWERCSLRQERLVTGDPLARRPVGRVSQVTGQVSASSGSKALFPEPPPPPGYGPREYQTLTALSDHELEQRIRHTRKALVELKDKGFLADSRALEHWRNESVAAKRAAVDAGLTLLKDGLSADLLNRVKARDVALAKTLEELLNTADTTIALLDAAGDKPTLEKELGHARDLLIRTFEAVSGNRGLVEAAPLAGKLAVFVSDYGFEATRWGVAYHRIQQILRNQEGPGGRLAALESLSDLHDGLLRERDRRRSGRKLRDEPSADDERMLETGSPIYRGDRIVTGADGKVTVYLLDRSAWAAGADSAVTVNDHVFDPITAAGTIDIRVSKGGARFISGEIAAQDHAAMTIRLPTGRIEPRGTDFTVRLDAAAVGSVTVEDGAVALFPDDGGELRSASAGERIALLGFGSRSAKPVGPDFIDRMLAWSLGPAKAALHALFLALATLAACFIIVFFAKRDPRTALVCLLWLGTLALAAAHWT